MAQYPLYTFFKERRKKGSYVVYRVAARNRDEYDRIVKAMIQDQFDPPAFFEVGYSYKKMVQDFSEMVRQLAAEYMERVVPFFDDEEQYNSMVTVEIPREVARAAGKAMVDSLKKYNLPAISAITEPGMGPLPRRRLLG